jgi:type I restriction enzyme M protein
MPTFEKTMTNNDIVQKLWNLCDVLKDDGINYSDYVSELVQLLFIKMVHENTESGVLDKNLKTEVSRLMITNKPENMI